MPLQTLTIRRDAVQVGDILHSSHGYKLLVTEIDDIAESRVDVRHIGIKGHLHADPTRGIRGERYPANSVVNVERRFPIPVSRNLPDAPYEPGQQWIEIKQNVAPIECQIILWTATDANTLDGEMLAKVTDEDDAMAIARVLSKRRA